MQTSMPGQAQGFQFAPQQAAGTPAAKVQNFRQIQDLPTLIAMQQRDPSIPLLAHIDEVRKKLEAQQAVQRQLAVQQSQQQGPQSLNDQILASAAQTAGMAPARGMATGGIVALSKGGATARFSDEQLREAYRRSGVFGGVEALLGARPTFHPRTGTQEARAAAEKWDREAADIKRRYEQLGRAQQAAPAAAAAAAAASTVPAAAPRIPGSSIVGKTGNPDIDIGPAEPPRLPRTRETRDAGSGSGTPAAREQRPAANDPLAQAFAAMTQAYAPPTVPPELLAQRKKIVDLQDLYAQQVLQDASLMRGEADKEIARREARANQPFFESAERPALLASYINPKKGQFFGSLAKGIAAIDIEEEKARKELAQYRATEAEKVRQLNNTYHQMQIESAKYVAALKENDLKTARESAEKLTSLRYTYEKDKAELVIKGREATAKETAANAAMAGVPSRQALAEAGLLEKRMKSQEGVQYAQLAAAKAKLMENPLADKTAIANIDAELTRLQRLMDVKYGGIGAAAPSAQGATDLDAAAERIIGR
jgi:hypothetical protein